MRRDTAQPFTQAPQGQVGLEMNIDDNEDTVTRPYGHNEITALAGGDMCNNCTVWQQVLMNKGSPSACTYVLAGNAGPAPEQLAGIHPSHEFLADK